MDIHTRGQGEKGGVDWWCWWQQLLLQAAHTSATVIGPQVKNHPAAAAAAACDGALTCMLTPVACCCCLLQCGGAFEAHKPLLGCKSTADTSAEFHPEMTRDCDCDVRPYRQFCLLKHTPPLGQRAAAVCCLSISQMSSQSTATCCGPTARLGPPHTHTCFLCLFRLVYPIHSIRAHKLHIQFNTAQPCCWCVGSSTSRVDSGMPPM